MADRYERCVVTDSPLAGVADGRAGDGHARTAETATPDDLAVSDEDLVEQVCDGREGALRQLYDRYARRAYSLARRVCVDTGMAEDVVQEVFVAFWRAPERFDPERGRFGTWLLTLVHHKSVDAVRRETASCRRTVPVSMDEEDWSMPPGPGADDDALRAVAGGQVRAALGELPGEQRVALALSYFAGHTQREIAVLTGVPLGTVKSRMSVGVRRLRGILGPVLGELAGTGNGGVG